MRNCKLCRLHRLCNDLPGFCFVLHYISLIIVLGLVAWFFWKGEALLN